MREDGRWPGVEWVAWVGSNTLQSKPNTNCDKIEKICGSIIAPFIEYRTLSTSLLIIELIFLHVAATCFPALVGQFWDFFSCLHQVSLIQTCLSCPVIIDRLDQWHKLIHCH